jgi:hypothetical protein
MDLSVCLKTGCMAILVRMLDNGRFEGPYLHIKQQLSWSFSDSPML